MRRVRGLFVPLLVVSALAAASFSLVATQKYGVAASPDSVAYLAAARSLRTGSLHTYTGEEYIKWPPALPALLAAIPGEPLVTARYLDALCLAALVLLVGVWTKEATGRLVGLAAAALVATSLPLLYVYSFLWSEPLFILLTTASLFCLAAHRVRPSTRMLLLAALLACLAALTRYSGIVLLAIGAVMLMVDATRSLRSRVKAALVFGAIGGGPLAVWLLRNWVVARTLTGRTPPENSLSAHLSGAWGALRGWTSIHVPVGPIARALGTSTAPSKGLVFVRNQAPSLLAIAIVSLLAWFAWRKRGALFSRTTLPDSSFWMATVFALGYVAFLLYVAVTSKLELLGDRVLSPIYPSLLVASLISAHHAWHEWSTRHFQPGIGTWVLLVAAVGVACMVLPYRALEVRSVLTTQAHHGAGYYTTDSVMHSETMANVTNWGPGVVYSNAPDLIYLRTGRITYSFPRRSQGLDDWLRRTRTMRIDLVEFDVGGFRRYLYTFDELVRHLRSPTITRYSDGIVASGARTVAN